MTNQTTGFFSGTGRRKTSVARVRLVPGEGSIVVNGKPLSEYFGKNVVESHIMLPLVVTDSLQKFNAMVKVEGGGFTGQAEAIRHGLARALVQADERLRAPLRAAGLLTRDPRMKERKKYGLKRARKAPQYTKR